MNVKEAESNFPGFRNALDAAWVQKSLLHGLRVENKHLSINSCAVADVRYESGKQCLILYRLALSDAYFAKSWEQLFLGKLLKAGEMPEHSSDRALLADGVVFIPFPYDPAMPWLPDTCNEGLVKSALNRALTQSPWTVANVTAKLLAYTPQMRATFLYDITVKDKGAGQEVIWQWIGKTNVYKKPQRVFANYWALWRAAAGSIAMPRPTAFFLSPQMTFQEKIQGIRLGAIVDRPDFHEVMQNTAVALAHFHQLRIPVGNERRLEQEAGTLKRWSSLLMDLRPDLKTRMETLQSKILARLENSFRIEAPIHADFHHTNILVEGKAVQLIDMDEMAFGDPALDVGRFLSSLRIPALRAYGSFEGLQGPRELFLETYLSRNGLAESRVRLFEAASLFTSAASAFRLQRPNWESEVNLLIEEAEQVFSRAAKAPAVPTAVRHVALTPDERVRWAKDTMYMTTLLAPFFKEKYEADLIGLELRSEEGVESYRRIAMKAIYWQGDAKKKLRIEVLLHQSKSGSALCEFLQEVESGMRSLDIPNFLPVPLAYLPEIQAVVIEGQGGKSLVSLIGTEEGADAVAEFARLLAAFHKLTPLPHAPAEADQNPPVRSYVLRHISLSRIRRGEAGLTVAFPVRKYVAHPFEDVRAFIEKLRAVGKKRQDPVPCEELCMIFCSAYAKALGVSADHLNRYT